MNPRSVVEIRIHVPHLHRVIYTANIGDAVYVLRAFEKETQKTPDKDLKIARTANAELKKMQQKTVNGMIFLEGSDNIFRDLGFPEAEAVNLLARSTLMIEIKKIIEERELTQAEAAKLSGVRQPRVSVLFTGKIEDFTVDMLMNWLSKLGKDASVLVKDRVVA
jgi:predicted XRE-type DNA-binding protein